MISALKVYFKVAWACKTPFVFLLDMKYKPISAQVLQDIGLVIKRAFEYLENVSDCDDAAWRFKAEASKRKENGVGFVIGLRKRGLHCWNIALREDGVFQIEPQTNKLIPHRKGYHDFITII